MIRLWKLHEYNFHWNGYNSKNLCYKQYHEVSHKTKKRYEIFSLIKSEEDKIKHLLNLGELFKTSIPDL